MILRLIAVVGAALVLAGQASACARPRASLSYLEGQIMCPTCHTTLDQSDAPAAQRIKVHIQQRIDKCWTVKQIEDELSSPRMFGAGILAAPPHKGFDLLAWWLPLGGILLGGAVLAFGVWRWSRKRDDDGPDGSPPLDAETEQRLDELLARLD
jgi:cytochrome c-type biogenesis protein CcmH/NrfF